MKTVAEIKKYIGQVSASDIGRAHKFFDGSTAYYLVESSDKINETTGAPVEYRVSYSKEHGFTCSCPSGQYGFANVKHPSGVCSHVRIAVMAADEERVGMAEMALSQAKEALEETEKHVLLINGKEASQEQYDCIMNKPAKPVQKVRGNLNVSKGFSLMK